MKKRNVRFILSVTVILFLFAYSLLSIHLATSSVTNEDSSTINHYTKHAGAAATATAGDAISQGGKTKIVAFCNHNYRSVGLKWFDRMTKLGYTTHLLVATDPAMESFLASKSNYRYEVAFPEPMPATYATKPKRKQDRAVLELLFAVRWKYLLNQLEQGTNVLLTDADNIFSRYIDLQAEMEEKYPTVDVWHAYATKYPNKVFLKQGFTVCGGMSLWRASKAGIEFARLIQYACGIMCDDQRVLNNLLLDINMTWGWTDATLASRISNNSVSVDQRFVGLPTLGLLGSSSVTGHKARVWDRDFAFRGPLEPDQCPKSNWVSMPIVEAKSRFQNWEAKLESFDKWDEICGVQ
eukprot:scaffold22589_cov138-Cylindrotheca_fusiformis.AAC.23